MNCKRGVPGAHDLLRLLRARDGARARSTTAGKGGRHERAGRWRAYDVRTEGVSLTRGLRRDLAALYRDGGIDRVLARMAAKLADPG